MTIRNVGLVLLGLALLLWFPMTRAVILFILPLGSGFDDLIFVAAAGIGVFILALDKTGSLPHRLRKVKWTFVVVLVGILILSAIIVSMLV